MAAVNAISREQAAEDLRSLYDDLAKRYGRVPNITGVMAHRPAALKAFSQLYGAVISEAPSSRGTRSWAGHRRTR